MEVLIRFIGIVLFACLGDDPNDACTGPVMVNAYLPDGREARKRKICLEEIPAHNAYIRVQQKHTASSGWTAVDCEPKNPECKLYPLDGDHVTVSGLGTSGGGVSQVTPGRRDLRLRNLYPNLKLLPHADAVTESVAWMELNAGSLSLEKKKHGMRVGELSQTVTEADITITATNASGPRTIVIEKGRKVVFDIVNVPEQTAIDHPIEENGPMPPEPHSHFFLHYALASNPPMTNCRYPSDPEPAAVTHAAPRNPSISVIAAYVACSNSTYP